jgi:C1A family cysteine protease
MLPFCASIDVRLGFKRMPHEGLGALSVAVLSTEMRANVPDFVDWSLKGAVTPVKNQGHCSSCWAYSVTESIESTTFIQTGKLYDFSEQQMISCDSKDQGCQGGDPPLAYAYAQQYGLAFQSDYPDTSSNSSQKDACNTKPKSQVKVGSWAYAVAPCTGGPCSNQDENGLKAVLAAHGPLSVCVNAMEQDPQPDSADWLAYKGGILKGTCLGGFRAINHCVQLVGYNTTAGYWKVRNSWGDKWGDAGYILLPMGVNACGIADEATFVQNVTLLGPA